MAEATCLPVMVLVVDDDDERLALAGNPDATCVVIVVDARGLAAEVECLRQGRENVLSQEIGERDEREHRG